jgi:hypothetical protein
MLGQSTGHHSLMRFRTGGCYHVIASAYNGIRLTTFGSATFSASVQIYGYRNS